MKLARVFAPTIVAVALITSCAAPTVTSSPDNSASSHGSRPETPEPGSANSPNHALELRTDEELLSRFLDGAEKSNWSATIHQLTFSPADVTASALVPTGLRGANDPDFYTYSMKNGEIADPTTSRTAGAGGAAPGVFTSTQVRDAMDTIKATRSDANAYGKANGLQMLSKAHIYVIDSHVVIQFYLLQPAYKQSAEGCSVSALERTYDFSSGALEEQQTKSTTSFPGKLEAGVCKANSPLYEKP